MRFIGCPAKGFASCSFCECSPLQHHVKWGKFVAPFLNKTSSFSCSDIDEATTENPCPQLAASEP